MPSASRANNRHDDAGTDQRKHVGRSGSGRSAGKAKVPDTIEVTLQHARFRHLSWSLASLAIGGVLLYKLGTVGKMVGVLVVLLALRSAYHFLRTLRHPAGTIRVTPDQVRLPEGLCSGVESSFAPEQIRHAFVLRRAVPWTQTAPVLILETEDRAYLYPRDWFTTESDQRRVLQAIAHHRSRQESGQAAEDPARNAAGAS